MRAVPARAAPSSQSRPAPHPARVRPRAGSPNSDPAPGHGEETVERQPAAPAAGAGRRSRSPSRGVAQDFKLGRADGVGPTVSAGPGDSEFVTAVRVEGTGRMAGRRAVRQRRRRRERLARTTRMTRTPPAGDDAARAGRPKLAGLHRGRAERRFGPEPGILRSLGYVARHCVGGCFWLVLSVHRCGVRVSGPWRAPPLHESSGGARVALETHRAPLRGAGGAPSPAARRRLRPGFRPRAGRQPGRADLRVVRVT